MKKQYKCVIVGHFNFKEKPLDGQSVKTLNVSNALDRVYGSSKVYKIDTHGGLFSKLFIFIRILSVIGKTKNIVFLLANRGIQLIVPFLLFLNKKRRIRLHYVVIGGWLPSMCVSKPKLKKRIEQIDRVYVETSSMKKALEIQGFSNITIMPNFKELEPLEESALIYQIEEPFTVCTFSRVMKEKGIEDAIEAVNKVNKDNAKVVYKLDIYGQIDAKQIDWFNFLMESFPSYISYKGYIDSDKTTSVIKNYFLMLFPSRFYTEGLPGTILDSYFAGVPVVASKWESFSDIVDDGNTGFGYEFDNPQDLYSILSFCAKNPSRLNAMKNNCLERARSFSPDAIIKIIDFFE